MILKIAVVCLYAVFIFLSAFFSSCEITFARANHKRLKDAADAGDKRAAKAVFIKALCNALCSAALSAVAWN